MCRKQTSDPDAWLLSELNGVVSTVMQASCLADDAKMRNASCKVYTGTAYFKPSALPWVHTHSRRLREANTRLTQNCD